MGRYSLNPICPSPVPAYYRASKINGGNTMLNWAITFFVIALIAAVLGFTGIAVAAAGIAKLMFVIFLVLFLISLVAHLGRAGSRV
jgi:uncharacterized membrane protein YtjA (UPF0391 family)